MSLDKKTYGNPDDEGDQLVENMLVGVADLPEKSGIEIVRTQYSEIVFYPPGGIKKRTIDPLIALSEKEVFAFHVRITLFKESIDDFVNETLRPFRSLLREYKVGKSAAAWPILMLKKRIRQIRRRAGIVCH